jgi:osmoprotectant transport system substrate-binding protein
MGRRRSVFSFAMVVGVALLSTACTSGSSDSVTPVASNDGTITVGSFDFSESALLAEIYSQALEAGGFRVDRAFNLGPREFVAPALAAGLIEFLPEYAGTALQFVSLDADSAAFDVTETHDALARELTARDVTTLAAAPAQDANAFVVRRETAERYGLQRLSDVARVASQLTFGGAPECPSRPLCLVGLEEVYGLKFEEFVALDVGGPLTRDALRDGVVDIALLFTTDPAIASSDLVQLEDDRGLQPAENVTPLVRTPVLNDSGPQLARAVDAVSERLTTDALRLLNLEVTIDQDAIALVASRWLEREGLA